MIPSDNPKSTGEMMTDIIGSVGNLIRNEVDLARTEMAGSLKRAAVALGAIVLAVVMAITGLNVLAAAVVEFAIRLGLPPFWAAVVVGAGFLLVAGAIYFSAKSSLNRIDFVPIRTARSVKRDAAAIKEAYNDQ